MPQVVDVTFAIMIGLIYCIIQPVITVMVLIFFMTSFVVAKVCLSLGGCQSCF